MNSYCGMAFLATHFLTNTNCTIYLARAPENFLTTVEASFRLEDWAKAYLSHNPTMAAWTRARVEFRLLSGRF